MWTQGFFHCTLPHLLSVYLSVGAGWMEAIFIVKQKMLIMASSVLGRQVLP